MHAQSPALNPLVQHQRLDASMRTKGNILVEKLWAKREENRRSKWRIES